MNLPPRPRGKGPEARLGVSPRCYGQHARVPAMAISCRERLPPKLSVLVLRNAEHFLVRPFEKVWIAH